MDPLYTFKYMMNSASQISKVLFALSQFLCWEKAYEDNFIKEMFAIKPIKSFCPGIIEQSVWKGSLEVTFSYLLLNAQLVSKTRLFRALPKDGNITASCHGSA